MNNSISQCKPDHDDEIRVLIHDLRGPAINAKAFNNDTTEAAHRLLAILGDSQRIVTPEERVEISEIIANDVVPCVAYVNEALVKLEERLLRRTPQ